MLRMLLEPIHEQFRASARAFCERSLAPRAEQFAEQRFIDRDLWQEAGRQGFLGLEVPEQYGGSEAGDYRFNTALNEELAGVGAAVVSSFGIHFDVVAPYLVMLTDEEQRQRWLPRFCTGDLVTAIAMTEPSGGSDLAALRTRATRSGSDWVLDGSKTFITNGIGADLVVVAAKTDPDAGARGVTLFAVERGMPGFERGRKLDKVGQPESDTAELFFDQVRVPATNVIGEVGRGFAHMMTLLPRERIGAAVSNLAHVRPVLEDTLDYARQRRAFGHAIGSFQYTKFRLAELVTTLDVAQAYVDSCVLALTRDELTAVDAAKAKWWSAQVQNEILDACVQIYGGYGYMREYRVARAWMDARVTRIWAGSNEIMKELVGRDLGF